MCRFAALIYVVEDENDLIRIFKVISFCAILISGLGVIEFYFKHRFLADVFPKGMLASLAQSNPMLATLADGTASYRNGIFRACSIFLVPLSFGEFEIMVIPIGLFFAIHRQNFFERCIGWTVVIGGMAGIFVSGSRGGYVGFIASMATFVVIWSIRKAISHRASLMPALVGTMGTVTFAIVIMLILFWPRAHNMVLGGGAEEASTQGRWVQWAAAWPLLKSNPIIGHGFVTGGFDIGSSIDSYVISLLVETGVPGFLFFTGMVLPADLVRRPRLPDRLVGVRRLGGRAWLQLHRLHLLQASSVGEGKPLSDVHSAGYGRYAQLWLPTEIC